MTYVPPYNASTSMTVLLITSMIEDGAVVSRSCLSNENVRSIPGSANCGPTTISCYKMLIRVGDLIWSEFFWFADSQQTDM
jgi:hypothetical protein